MLRAASCVGLVALGLSATGDRAAAAAVPLPDWQAAREEAARHLAAMVRVDTSNPPGNETAVARYIGDVLERQGIPAEILEMEPGRGNLVARLRGSGEQRPLLLMSHLDVVGVERPRWTVEPFAAAVRDGFLYGRGAFDDKGMTAVNLQVVLMLHRLQVPLRRDVILLAAADEESGGRAGIRFLIDRHWGKIACEFALNEGGWIHEQDGAIQYVGVAAAEKGRRRIRLVARGSSGHSSMPRDDNAIVHLAAAVAKVGTLQMPMRLNETTRTFFRRLAAISPPAEAAVYRDLEDPQRSAAAQEKLRAMSIYYNAMLRTTLSPTIIKGGFRDNVIPGEAEATIDVRTLPGEDMPAVVATLGEAIGDPAVEVVPPPRELRLIARSGNRHDAPGRLDNAVTRLAAAVVRARSLQMPMRLSGPALAFFRQPGLVSTAARPALAIPAQAVAIVDLQAVPDARVAAVVATLTELIDDPGMEVVPPPIDPAPSPLDSELFSALEHAQARVFPEAVTLPLLLPAATDSTPLRTRGVRVYGLGSVATDEELARLHGNDERISLAGLGRFVEFAYRAVLEIAGPP
jgi:acetylornithine deacetylase/succinyl-diaminopimelate desuccinylase-like protein